MKIYRYEVPVDDQWHKFQLTGSLLHVGCRDPRIVEFWAFHRDDWNPWWIKLRVVGTGQNLPEGGGYIGTAYSPDGKLVWHLIEDGSGDDD